MLEFLVECVLFLFRKLHIRLPDCPALFVDVIEGKRATKAPPRVYVWLCQLLGAAAALRIMALMLFIGIVATLFWHFVPYWPFFDFVDPVREATHYIYWSMTPMKGQYPIHYCEVLAVSSMTTFITIVLFFRTLAWVAEVMVREFFPVKTESPSGVSVQSGSK